jgi:hypothetical protein
MKPRLLDLPAVESLLYKLSESLRPQALALRQLGATIGQIEQRFLAWNRSTRPQVERAIAAFARGQCLPPLTTPEATMLRFRAGTAHAFVSGMSLWEKRGLEPGQAPRIRDTQTAWSFFLLQELWEEETGVSIPDVLEELDRGNASLERIPDKN